MKSCPNTAPTTVIEPESGWQVIDWKELRDYRDLFLFLTWRHVKVQYSQSTLGIGWAVIQPLFSMLVFSLVFGELAKVESDGIPYPIFSFVALIPWTYFSNAVTDGTNSLINNSNMLSKVYFPRMVLPLSAVCAKLVDFGIGIFLLGILMAWYRIAPNWGLLLLPFLILLMVVSALGLGMWMTALAIQYRDVKYGLNFFMQLLMYMAPVVYPTSLIPQKWRFWYGLNPMVGVIEGFRAAVLGQPQVPWDLLLAGSITAIAISLSGCFYFRSKERIFADVA